MPFSVYFASEGYVIQPTALINSQTVTERSLFPYCLGKVQAFFVKFVLHNLTIKFPTH